MSAAAAASALSTAAWPATALYVVAFLFGLTASGWNGIFLAEIARIAPGGRVAVVTGGVQVIAYSGLVATPLAFSGVVAISGSYGAAYLATAGLSLAGTMLLRKVDA
jgi:hypothetical protein